MHDQPNVPYGYCHCGCGQKTTISSHDVPRHGYVRGEPRRYVIGHNARRLRQTWLAEDRGFETPCWIWQGRIEANGYSGVHRRAWENANGPIPPRHHIHHRCEQRDCINPAHLEALPPSSHLREHATLTPSQVGEIRSALAQFSGYGACARIAREYGVAPKTINDIKNGKTWVGV